MTEETIAALPVEDWRNYWNSLRANRLGLPTNFFATRAEQFAPFVPGFESIFQIGRSFAIVMDYQKVSYLYVQGSCQKILGYTEKQILDGGIEFLFHNLHPDDQQKIAAASVYFQDFIHAQPLHQRTGIKASLNLRLKAADGRYVRFLEQVLVLHANSDGLITHTLKHLTDISHLPFTDKITITFHDMQQHDMPLIHSVVVEDTGIVAAQKNVLSKREHEILELIAAGHTSKSIAAALNLSADTVKNHRKNMLKKTGTGNIAELLNLAFLNNWFG